MVVDFDNDGFRDMIITNGFPKDVTDHDFSSFWSNVSGYGGKDIILKEIPAVKITNYAFRNRGDLTFEDVTGQWGITRPSFSNGAAYADLDNDGDLDYVVNNINDSAFVYRNNLVEQHRGNSNHLRIKFKGEARNRMGLGTFVEIRYGRGQQQVYEHSPYRGYLSSVEPVAHFGLGSVQTVAEVKIIWQNGKVQTLKNVKANQTLTVDAKNASPQSSTLQKPQTPPSWFADLSDSLETNYIHEEEDYIDFHIQKLLPHKFSQYGPSVSVGDVDGDGLDDLFLGGSTGHKGRFYCQKPDGTFAARDILGGGEGAQKPQEDMGTLLFDADSDGDPDLYIVSGGYEQPAGSAAYRDRLYTNEKGKFVLNPQALPDLTESGSCVKAADFDRDGDLDLFVGGRVKPGRYPLPAARSILQNNTDPASGKGRAGAGLFTDITQTVSPGLAGPGMVSDALWTDYDNDGWTDLLLAGEFMPPTFFRNSPAPTGGAGARILVKAPASGAGGAVGWWNSLVSGDFDNDGDTDYLAGNLGLNTLNKASPAEPARVYAKDFDNNGYFDAIPSVYFKDETGKKQEFPFFGRDDMVKQMIGFRRTFTDYRSFATAPMEKVLSPEDRKGALILAATEFRSSYVENLGKGRFAIRPLPVQAQFAPVFGMLAGDFDGDGNLDVLLVGNDFGCEIGQGRMDALNGLLLQGDGKGGFVPKTMAESGICVPGDAKGLAQFTNARGESLAVATQNRGGLKIFRSRKTFPVIRARANDAYALLTHKDGRTRKHEFHYGHSFQSQSARLLHLTPSVKSVEIVDFKGNRRTAGVGAAR